MKLKLFSAAILTAVFTLASCGGNGNITESQEPEESSEASSSVNSIASKSESSSKAQSSSSSSKASSSSSRASSSSSKASSSSSKASSSVNYSSIPAFGNPVNDESIAPTEASPLVDGKFPATGQKPSEAMSNSFLRLFAYDAAPKIYLNFNKNTLKAMSDWQHDRNNRKVYDAYFPANFRLVLDGKTYDYEEVGVRLKGNWSRHEICDANGNIVNNTHLKISFKQTFDDDIYDYNGPLAYDSTGGNTGGWGGGWGGQTTQTNVDLRPFKHDWTSDPEGRAARKSRTLFGMEKLDLKVTPRNDAQGTGGANNACISREVYSYGTFRDNALLAPYSNLASVTLNNGTSSKTGTYQIVECVDKSFLKKRFTKNDAKGDLYKCAKNTDGDRANFTMTGALTQTNGTYTKDTDGFVNAERKAVGVIGCEDTFTGYDPVYQLKTNDVGETSNYTKLSKLIGSLDSIVKDNITQEKKQARLESLIDVDYFLKFTAVSYLMGNCDDQRYAGNNFYLYFVPSTGKMLHIAYDWDWCLGAAYSGFDMSKLNPFDTYVPEGGNQNYSDQREDQQAYQKNPNITFSGPSGTSDRTNANYDNNLYWATILAPTSQKTQYASTLGYINGYRNTYLKYCRDLSLTVLDIQNFSAINTVLKSKFSTLKLTEEKNVTQSFMTARKTALTSYINAHPITEAQAQ